MNNKVKLDLLIIDTHNPKTLGIADISFYPQGVSIVNPSIQITPPNLKKVTLPFTAKNLTIYNSNILEITCVDEDCQLITLPDGIWKIKYTITPANEHVIEKNFIRTEQIQQEWAESFLTTDIDGCSTRGRDRQKEELYDIWNLIQGAIADANNSNNTSSMNKYRLAAKMLKNFKRL